MSKTAYVAGFLFSEDRQNVLLIEKIRPKWQQGKLNGVGGRIESGESPAAAMAREFQEEAGIGGLNWQPVARLDGGTWVVDFFAAFSDKISHARAQTDEQLVVVPVREVAARNIIPNLSVLIALALDESGIAKPVALVDETLA